MSDTINSVGQQDVNKIINSVAQQFAAVQIEDKKLIAVLSEENARLNELVKSLSNNNPETDSE